MDSRLKDRIALITGASSGIGKATALRFANSGARIVCADLSSAGVEKEITDKHGSGRAIFVKCDVRNESEIQSMIGEAVKWGGRLDIMCNYAGISVETETGKPLRVHEIPVSNYDRTQAVNQRGTWLCCKYGLGQMLGQESREPNARGDRSRGWIINAASIFGLIALPGTACYVPSKHAVIGMTKQFASDYAADRIHVNCLCPGFVDSPFTKPIFETEGSRAPVEQRHPWGALGTPEDVADAALFLASDEAAWVTGHSLVVDGGYTSV